MLERDYEVVPYVVEFLRYTFNNRLAIRLIDPITTEVVTMVTINLPHIELKDDEVLVKVESDGIAVLEALVENGLLEISGKYVIQADVSAFYPICKVVPAVNPVSEKSFELRPIFEEIFSSFGRK